MTKKKLLVIELVSVVAVLLLAYIQDGDTCYSMEWCHNLWDDINLLGEMLLIIVSLLPFLLVTYKMKDEVFQAWWNFARWFVPVIIAFALLFNAAGSGGSIGMGKDFAAFTLITLYSAFILVSLIKIVRAYKRTR